MTFCNKFGHPDPNGDFELDGGKICLRNGRQIRFDVYTFDSSTVGSSVYFTDAPAAPKSIDEALRLEFAGMAKARGITVAEMLAEMSQQKIEETAATVARKFVSSAAGSGVAKMMGDATMLTDGETTAILNHAKMIHDQTHAWQGANAPAFTDADGQRALASEIQRRQQYSSREHVNDDQAAQTRAAAAYAQMVADQSNAWRSGGAHQKD